MQNLKKYNMKKLLILVVLSIFANVSMAQKITVVDTVKMELTGVANQPTIHKIVMDYKSDGWRIISAERVIVNNQELYVWKLETYVSRKIRKN